jgi:RDD family protein
MEDLLVPFNPTTLNMSANAFTTSTTTEWVPGPAAGARASLGRRFAAACLDALLGLGALLPVVFVGGQLAAHAVISTLTCGYAVIVAVAVVPPAYRILTMLRAQPYRGQTIGK